MKSFGLVIFPVRIRVYCGPGEVAAFNRATGERISAETHAGHTATPDVWLHDVNDLGSVVHETGHISDDVADMFELPGQEIRSWIQEYLFNKITGRAGSER